MVAKSLCVSHIINSGGIPSLYAFKLCLPSVANLELSKRMRLSQRSTSLALSPKVNSNQESYASPVRPSTTLSVPKMQHEPRNVAKTPQSSPPPPPPQPHSTSASPCHVWQA